MNKEILSEINRFKEILGLSIINEGKIPIQLVELLSKAFNKTKDDFLESLGKGELVAIDNIFDDLSKLKNISVETLIDDFKFGDMTNDVEDLFIVSMLKSNNPSIVNAAVKSYANSTKSPLIDIIENTFKKLDDDTIKKLSPEDLKTYKNDINQLIDETSLTDNTKSYLKQEFNNKFIKIRSNIESPKPPSTEEAYRIAEIEAKKRGKELPTLDYIQSLADELTSKGITKTELIDIILSKATDKKGLIDYIKTGKNAGSEVGDALVKTTEGGISLSKKALTGWSLGALGLLGLIAFGFDWFKMRSTILYGTKSGLWSKTYKENFYDLPEDIQVTITSNYDDNRITTDTNNKEGIKSFTYNENNENEFIVNLMSGEKDVWKKVSTAGVESWSKINSGGEEDSVSLTPEQTIEKFKEEVLKGENKWTDEDLRQVSDFNYKDGKITYKQNWGDNKIITIDYK